MPISAREICAVVTGFVLTTVALTYPQVRHLGDAVGTHYDALFTIWRLAWVAHAAVHDPLHLFDANIFYPARGTLAYSDAMLLPAGVGAPLIWLGVHPVVVYNLLVLTSFVASGTAMYVLARELTRSRAAAWFAGSVFAFTPYRFGHLPQLELLWDWPIPLALWAFHRLVSTLPASGASNADRGSRARIPNVYGFLIGVFVAAEAWSSLYYAVFLVTALAILALAMLVGRRPLRHLPSIAGNLAVSVAVCLVLVGPYASVYARTASRLGPRSEQDVREWSPTLHHYLVTEPENWLHGGRWRGESLEMYLFPGATVLLAAAVALWPPLNRTRLAYGVLLVIAVDLSLGVHGISYPTLYRTVSLYRELRVPARMFVIVASALAVLGAHGVVRLLGLGTNRVARFAIGAACLGGVLIESASVPLSLMPVTRTPPSIYSWLKKQSPSVVLEWPMPKPWMLGYTHEPLYMYYSIGHWQRLVNGYSGFYPGSYIDLLEATAAFPSSEAIAYLRRTGVDFVILHGEFDDPAYAPLRDQLISHPSFELITGDRVHGGELTLYRLRHSG